jgi:predicted transcriptional regulator
VTAALPLHLPPDLDAAVARAVADGSHPSPQAVIEAALRDWQRRTEALRAALDEGLADLAVGRTEPFDVEAVLAAARDPSDPSRSG